MGPRRPLRRSRANVTAVSVARAVPCLCAMSIAVISIAGTCIRAFTSSYPILESHLAAVRSFQGDHSAARLARLKTHATAAKRRPRRRGFAPTTPIDDPPTGYDTKTKLLSIVKYPHPALRRPNSDVTVFDDKLRQLADNLFNAMYTRHDGIGLAAPQVGVNVRMMVYNPLRTLEDENREGDEVYVNPRIVQRSDEEDVVLEECLSFPKVRGPVRRSLWVEVEAVDLEGKPFKRRIEGFEARLFQHEFDHLQGVVFIDHIPDEQREEVQPALDKLQRTYKLDGGRQPAL